MPTKDRFLRLPTECSFTAIEMAVSSHQSPNNFEYAEDFRNAGTIFIRSWPSPPIRIGVGPPLRLFP
jgi:hypothetical protein